MNRAKNVLYCFYKAAEDTIQHDGVEHAGYMAFLSLLALFPFLVFFVALVGFIGASDLGIQFVKLLLANLPKSVALTLEPRIEEITSGPPQGLLTLAIVGAIWTASSAVEGLRTILNRVYRVTAPPAYIWRRLLSILQFLILTATIIVAMMVLVFTPIIWDKLSPLFPLTEWLSPLWAVTRYALVGAVLFVGIASLYYILPNLPLKWRHVLPGSALVVLLWMGVGILLSLYLNYFHQANLIYGSLGGIIFTLVFFYLVSLIFIYGAEFNYRLEKLLAPSELIEAQKHPKML
jgi:membrane protein